MKTTKNQSKSDQMRSLFTKGFTIAEIAKTVKAHYSFTFTVISLFKAQNPETAAKNAKIVADKMAAVKAKKDAAKKKEKTAPKAGKKESKKNSKPAIDVKIDQPVAEMVGNQKESDSAVSDIDAKIAAIKKELAA